MAEKSSKMIRNFSNSLITSSMQDSPARVFREFSPAIGPPGLQVRAFLLFSPLFQVPLILQPHATAGGSWTRFVWFRILLTPTLIIASEFGSLRPVKTLPYLHIVFPSLNPCKSIGVANQRRARLVLVTQHHVGSNMILIS